MASVYQSVSAWRHALESILMIGTTLPDAAWAAPTECPGWTVKDVYAHLLGGEEWMASGQPPLAGSMDDWTASHVAAHRDTTTPALLRRLREIFELRLLQLQRGPVVPTAPAPLPTGGTGTLEQLLRVRVLDVWAHEQDIRRAAGRPGNLASPGAAIAGELFTTALPTIVAKQAAATPGSSFRLTTKGELEIDLGVTVDHTGRGALAAPSQSATSHVQLSWEAYTRLSCGRGDRADYEIRTAGDRGLAERVLTHLTVTP